MMASRDVVVEGAPSLSLPRKRERGRSRFTFSLKARICSLSREAGDGWGGGRS
jgi:hypothetical protein